MTTILMQPELEDLSGHRCPAVNPEFVTALPWPAELPAGLRRNLRVTRLVDMDSVSHGLADGTPISRAPNRDVQTFVEIVGATARALDPQSRIRCGASSVTATTHVDLLTASGNNEWAVRRGLDGADQVLLEEMNHLISTRRIATRPRTNRAAQHTNLVILAGQDHIYAPPVRQLRLMGIPTWLIVPGRIVAASLYSCACAVSFLGPNTPCPFPSER
jgi:hypothetical protein